MANPQLEDGHVRIANELEEAIIFAKFSATQMKIVRCIIRLTWGWRQRTVRISHQDLAIRCNTTAAGGFRKEFHELVREGVILEIEAAHGRTPAAYAINKDYERWGRLSVPPSALTALFSDRPDRIATRNLPSQGQSTDATDLDSLASEGHSNEGASLPSGGQSENRSLPSPVLLPALRRATKSTGKGTLISVSTSDSSDLDPGKDSSKQRKTKAAESHARAGAREDAAAAAGVASDVEEQPLAVYAEGLASAANLAIVERWPTLGRDPFLAGGFTRQMAADLLAAGVPLELARNAIVDKIRDGRFEEPPFSMRYFVDVIADAVDVDRQRRLDRESSIPDRGGQPTRLSPADIAAASDRGNEQLRLWERERKRAATTWRLNPANAEQLATIVAKARTHFADASTNAFSASGLELEIAHKCAEAAGVPDFDTWLALPASRAAGDR